MSLNIDTGVYDLNYLSLVEEGEGVGVGRVNEGQVILEN